MVDERINLRVKKLSGFSRLLGRIVLLGIAAFSVHCASRSTSSLGSNFDSPAHRPNNPSDVRVKVSLANQMIYVMEKDRPLLVTPTCVGTPDHPTPKGDFTAYNKIAKKRSYTYGYHVTPNGVKAGTSGETPSGARYVGYPMAYWVEFKPTYGFHSGWVWPVPRTHGCLRLHQNVAPKFFELVRPGTQINIAQTQPEDATLGRNVARPTDYNAPDLPGPVIITDAAFPAPKGPLFVD